MKFNYHHGQVQIQHITCTSLTNISGIPAGMKCIIQYFFSGALKLNSNPVVITIREILIAAQHPVTVCAQTTLPACYTFHTGMHHSSGVSHVYKRTGISS